MEKKEHPIDSDLTENNVNRTGTSSARGFQSFALWHAWGKMEAYHGIKTAAPKLFRQALKVCLVLCPYGCNCVLFIITECSPGLYTSTWYGVGLSTYHSFQLLTWFAFNSITVLRFL